MTLNLNWTKTPAAVDLTRNENLTYSQPNYAGMGTVTFAVGVAMMVTDSDVVDAEFFGRMMAYTKLNGGFFSYPAGVDEEHETLLTVLARVGMTANSTPRDREQYVDRIMKVDGHGVEERREFRANIKKYSEIFTKVEHDPRMLLDAIAQVQDHNATLERRIAKAEEKAYKESIATSA